MIVLKTQEILNLTLSLLGLCKGIYRFYRLIVFLLSVIHIIEHILSFLEDHSVFVGIVTSMIVSSLWLRKILKQKRAEAFFGFYAQLSLCLKNLHTVLNENGRLNVSNPENGNIYSLIYTESYINVACPYFAPIYEEELQIYQKASNELKEILTKTENNVYPPGGNRRKWYDSQYVLYAFCEFLNNTELQHTTNKHYGKNRLEPNHISKCKTLVDAMNYIQKSIENAKY